MADSTKSYPNGCLDVRESYTAGKINVPGAPVKKHLTPPKSVPSPKGGK